MNSIRQFYQTHGVDNYYKNHSDSYSNPHQSIIHKHLNDILPKLSRQESILDLCCGTGEVSLFLIHRGFNNIIGCDPYTHSHYVKNTSKECLIHDFKYLAKHGLPQSFDTIICSFALHLCPVSLLPTLLYQLSLCCKKLIIISPSKKPAIKLHFKQVERLYYQKVYCNTYISSHTPN